MSAFPVSTAVVGLGVRQYKRGGAPLPEQGVLVGAIVDACEDAESRFDVPGLVEQACAGVERIEIEPEGS